MRRRRRYYSTWGGGGLVGGMLLGSALGGVTGRSPWGVSSGGFGGGFGEASADRSAGVEASVAAAVARAGSEVFHASNTAYVTEGNNHERWTHITHGLWRLLILILMLGGCVYSGYNRVIEMDEAVKSQWAQVENQLQRRFELIPNLVNTVKGVASQEEKIYLGVANARKAYFQAQSVNEKARAAGGFESALSRLLVLRETYPQLKSDQSFLSSRTNLKGRRIDWRLNASGYNDSVRVLNTFIRNCWGGSTRGWPASDKPNTSKSERKPGPRPRWNFRVASRSPNYAFL